MEYQPETPFDTIEGAQQFVQLLGEAIEEAQKEIAADLESPLPDRRKEALQLVAFKLAKLSTHNTASQRILNDLRTLRRLLLGERAVEQEHE